MGANPLSARSIRRIARSTGLDIAHASGWGGYAMTFTTVDHRHGAWHRRTHTWWWREGDDVCMTSCARLFTADQPPVLAVDGGDRHTCECGFCPASHHRAVLRQALKLDRPPHTHLTCPNPVGEGVICTEGILTGYCLNDGTCHNEYCASGGHCGCNCHSNRRCGCGHIWPKMPKLRRHP